MISNVLNVSESINMIGENNTKKILSSFSCVIDNVQLNEEDNSNAYDFYIKCGFKAFDKRYSESDEKYYILMMKIF